MAVSHNGNRVLPTRSIAQRAERIVRDDNDSDEVVGSIPTSSTMFLSAAELAMRWRHSSIQSPAA